jgi:hypothetical protein
MLALLVRLLTAWALRQPGYTDAYYYAVGARQLYAGEGFSEPFVWNYLDPPETVPHPGYRYWMPLTALVGWVGMAFLGDSFRAMQAPFVLLSALLPLVTYGLTWDLTGQRRHALLAGLLAVVPGFYAHVLVLPDNFAPFALAGSVCLWMTGRGLQTGQSRWLALAGLAAGLGHLARADGVLLLGVALLGTIPFRGPGPNAPTGACPGRSLQRVLLITVGYLLVMGPWVVRSWQVNGSLIAGAGLSTAFLKDYDDIFAYGTPLTWQSYVTWGWGAILESKARALLVNLQRLWAEGLMIFLLPLTALGLWRLRRERLLWPVFAYLPALFIVMTFVFTFPGMRGGLFHSTGALLPFFFAAAGPGLETALRWGARRFRGWQVRRAWPVFSAGVVVLAALVTGLALWQAGLFDGTWNRRDEGYAAIDRWLDETGVGNVVVMVGDAPAFSWHTGHPAIAVPNEPLDTVVAVAERYAALYLVLDDKRPRTTDALYAGEEAHPRLVQRYSVETWQVYEITPPSQ